MSAKPKYLRQKKSLIKNLLRLQAKARDLYAMMDIDFHALQGWMDVGELVTLEDGRTFEIVDHFGDKNIAYKPARFARYELKEETKKAAGERAKGLVISRPTREGVTYVELQGGKNRRKPIPKKPEGADADSIPGL